MALFSEYFDFVSWSLARRNLNFGGFGHRRAAAEAAQKRGGGQNPQTLTFVLRAITKQNQNTQKKVPTTQPNPQYSAKNNVSIHMIETFMPKLPLHYFSKLPPHQQHFIILQYLIHFYRYGLSDCWLPKWWLCSSN